MGPKCERETVQDVRKNDLYRARCVTLKEQMGEAIKEAGFERAETPAPPNRVDFGLRGIWKTRKGGLNPTGPGRGENGVKGLSGPLTGLCNTGQRYERRADSRRSPSSEGAAVGFRKK